MLRTLGEKRVPEEFEFFLHKGSRKRIKVGRTLIAMVDNIACTFVDSSMVLCGDIGNAKEIIHTNAIHLHRIG